MANRGVMPEGARFAVLAATLLLGVLGLVASARCSTAQGAEFVYLLKKVELKAGETKELEKSSDGATYRFEKTGFLTPLKIECKFMSVLNGAYIAGGKPGVSFMTLEWTSCSGTSKGKACTEIQVISPLLRGEVVEQTLLSENGFAASELSPAEGSTLIRFNMICGGTGEERIAKGSFLARPSSQCSNLESIEFSLPGNNQKVRTSKGGEPVVEATMDGVPMLLNGSTNLKLKEKGLTWGLC